MAYPHFKPHLTLGGNFSVQNKKNIEAQMSFTHKVHVQILYGCIVSLSYLIWYILNDFLMLFVLVFLDMPKISNLSQKRSHFIVHVVNPILCIFGKEYSKLHLFLYTICMHFASNSLLDIQDGMNLRLDCSLPSHSNPKATHKIAFHQCVYDQCTTVLFQPLRYNPHWARCH